VTVRHRERHRADRIGWLCAAVLGANDGIVSTASLVLGVAAAHGTHSSVMVAGIAGLVAGAMSMAAGEYVSVRSQAERIVEWGATPRFLRHHAGSPSRPGRASRSCR
jgi:VIT1/CCC1 family predicted Fe2+/Mn2+ transporter